MCEGSKETSEGNCKHLNKERLCYHCNMIQNSKSDIKTLTIDNRGYGSDFDCETSYIQLCENCFKEEYIYWFSEIPVLIDEYCEIYKNEDKINALVKSFPINNQEYFYNSDMYGEFCSQPIDRQDWIDMKNGVMEDEMYKFYKMYSPSEIKAYQDRFTTCQHPWNGVYSDGSIGCYCTNGASGRENQVASPNISTECFNCPAYIIRETPIVTMPTEEFKEWQESRNKEFDEALKKFGGKL